ncbi:MAG: hypothetical protein ACN4EP_00845 [Sediminibacterium sp.]
MHYQFIGIDDHPMKVVIDYDDFLEIAKKLQLKLEPRPVIQQMTGMDWYALKESSHSIISGLIALTSREIMLEEEKHSPDQERIQTLSTLQTEVLAIHRSSSSFSTADAMQSIIDKYSPILLSEKKKLKM